MRHIILASTAIFALLATAQAAEKSVLGIDNKLSHIKVLRYSATKRSEIIGLLGQPTTFTFPSDEQVYRVVQTKPIGAKEVAAAWEASSPEQVKDTPLGNNLTLWPMQEGTTIMTVITMGEHGGQKAYAFKLIAKPDPTGMPDDPDAVFNVRFEGTASPETRQAAVATGSADEVISKKSASNDPPPRKARRSSKQATREANEQELAADRLRTDSFNQDGACHYHGQGDPNSPIRPRCPLSNDIWTLIRFPGLSQKPSVYIGTCSGQNERVARVVGSGDFIMIQEIAAAFCLRLGAYALNIINDAYNPAGTPTGNGTISTGTQRQILQESSRQ